MNEKETKDKASTAKKFYGKYRARVVNNHDPEKLGRLQASLDILPAVAEIWALPSMPYAGKDVGMFIMPPKGAMVWLEFEGGNIDVPIWSGCFWEKPEDNPAKDMLKAPEDADKTMVFKTEGYACYISKQADDKGYMKVQVEPPVSKYPFMLHIAKNQLKLTSDVENKDKKQALTVALNFKDDQSIKLINSVGENKKQSLVMQGDHITLNYQGGQVDPASLSFSEKGITLNFKESSVKLRNSTSFWEQGNARIDLTNKKINLNRQGLEVS